MFLFPMKSPLVNRNASRKNYNIRSQTNVFSARERRSIRNIVLWQDCIQCASFIDTKYRVFTLELFLVKSIPILYPKG